MIIKKFEEINSANELNEQLELREKEYKNLYYLALIISGLAVFLFFLPFQDNALTSSVAEFMNPISFAVLIGSIGYNLFIYHRYLTQHYASFKNFGILNFLIFVCLGNFVFLGHVFEIFP